MIAPTHSCRMLGCTSNPRLTDSTIILVERMNDDIHVLIEPRIQSGALISPAPYSNVTVVFHDVDTVEAIHPERMMFATLIHWDAPHPLCRFEFANWFQPGDDWDPYMSQARLEITACAYSVVDLQGGVGESARQLMAK
jgi:hypothetical protein